LLLAHAFKGYTAHVVSGVDVPDGAGHRRRFGNMILSRLPFAKCCGTRCRGRRRTTRRACRASRLRP
jgi:hypothetical protein